MNIREFREGVRQPHAWPGGYPLFGVMSDGEAMCFDCMKENRREILEAIRDQDSSGWRLEAFEINWEDPRLYCCQCNKRLESAYAEDQLDGDGSLDYSSADG